MSTLQPSQPRKYTHDRTRKPYINASTSFPFVNSKRIKTSAALHCVFDFLISQFLFIFIMRSSLAILSTLGFCLHAQAQNPSDLINSLEGAGLTSLASALQRVNETQEGQSLISQLLNGNHTLFAPDNRACESFTVNVNLLLCRASYFTITTKDFPRIFSLSF